MDDDQRRRRAHDTMDHALELLLGHDMTGYAGLWATDGTMDFPFAAGSAPRHLDGRDAVAAYLSGYNAIIDPREVTDDIRHDTADPDTIVVEFEVAGQVVTTNAPYRMRYVAVVTVGDDGITSYRDYWSPLAAQEFLGASGLTEAGR